MSSIEHEEFLAKFDARYSASRMLLDGAIAAVPEIQVDHAKAPDVEKISQAIIQLIKSCPANDILANLHDYLLLEKFDYLRTGKGFRGTDAKAQVVETSKAWADIQKAFSAQIAVNTINNTSFTEIVGSDYAQRYSADFPFFSLLRPLATSRPGTTNGMESATAPGPTPTPGSAIVLESATAPGPTVTPGLTIVLESATAPGSAIALAPAIVMEAQAAQEQPLSPSFREFRKGNKIGFYALNENYIPPLDSATRIAVLKMKRSYRV